MANNNFGAVGWGGADEAAVIRAVRMSTEHGAEVTTGEGTVEVLEQPHAPAGSSAAIGSKLDHVELVVAAERTREVGEEDGARLQRRDEDGQPADVLRLQQPTELVHAGGDLPPVEVDRPNRLSLRPQTLRGGRHEAMRNR